MAPSTPTAPLRAGSSTAPDDPIMSFFLLVPLLMSHQGKHFPARRMQVWQLHCEEASSGRQPAEQPRQEGGVQQCHVHVSIHWDLLGHNLHYKQRLNQSHFCLQRGPSALLQQQHMGKHSNRLLPLQQTCCSRTPVTAAGYCW